MWEQWLVALCCRNVEQPSHWMDTRASGLQNVNTEYLVYEAYESMALSEMQRLGAEAHKRFEIAHVGIVHRTGRLEIGETSVVIAVSAPHRRAAFEACEWAIKEFKTHRSDLEEGSLRGRRDLDRGRRSESGHR